MCLFRSARLAARHPVYGRDLVPRFVDGRSERIDVERLARDDYVLRVEVDGYRRHAGDLADFRLHGRQCPHDMPGTERMMVVSVIPRSLAS